MKWGLKKCVTAAVVATLECAHFSRKGFGLSNSLGLSTSYSIDQLSADSTQLNGLRPTTI